MIPYQIYTTMDKPENPYPPIIIDDVTGVWVSYSKYRCWQEGADAQFDLSAQRIRELEAEMTNLKSDYNRLVIWLERREG